MKMARPNKNGKKVRAYKWLTAQEYTSIKALQASGCSNKVVCGATGRSQMTVKRIFDTDTFDDYRKLVEALSQKKAVKTVVIDTPQPVNDPNGQTHTFTNEAALLERLANATEQIAIAVERLADAWESTPNKRRLF
jgi:IS30 family transposase